MKRERDILTGVSMVEAALERDLKRKCDWKAPADRSVYLAGRRHRVAVGTCRCCGETKLGATAWKHGTRLCRTCSRIKPEGASVDVVMFKAVEAWAVDGRALCLARESVGVSMRLWAKRCGWSAAYQNKLENHGPTMVDKTKMEKIRAVAASFGVKTLD